MNYGGFNFFAEADVAILQAVVRGEHVIQGMRNKTLRQALPKKSSGQVARIIKRLRLHGLIRKVGSTQKYYVTELGRAIITTALELTRMVLIPELAKNTAT